MLWLLTINRTSNSRLVIETNSVANYNVGNNVDFKSEYYIMEEPNKWNLF